MPESGGPNPKQLMPMTGSVALLARHSKPIGQLSAMLSSDVLPGITRAWVLATGPREGFETGERRLTVAEVADADEAFLTNSIQEIVPLVDIDGIVLRRGEAARTLLTRYREAVDQGREMVAPG